MEELSNGGESSVIERAKKIVQEVEAQIPLKAKLLEAAD